jgi:hypothetical protein
MRKWTIYALKDPRTDEVRYAHRSSRLREHIREARVKRTHSASWIRSLGRVGLEPVFQVLEEGWGEGWGNRERYWISEYRRLGAKLTNHTDGGEGSLGWNPPPEWRAKQASRPHRKGFKHSEQSKKNMSKGVQSD